MRLTWFSVLGVNVGSSEWWSAEHARAWQSDAGVLTGCHLRVGEQPGTAVCLLASSKLVLWFRPGQFHSTLHFQSC